MLYLAMNFGHGEANLWHHYVSLFIKEVVFTDTDNIENNINHLITDVDINTINARGLMKV